MAELILACLNILYIFLEYDDVDQPNVNHQEKLVHHLGAMSLASLAHAQSQRCEKKYLAFVCSLHLL